MKHSARNIKLASVDDLFRTDEERADDLREKVMEIPLSEFHAFHNHPFKVLDDDAATVIMVDSNLQRDHILPSERAFAYKMKFDAMKRQAGRPSKNNWSQIGTNFGIRTGDLLAEQLGQSKNQIFRYIRLTELIPFILDMVDQKKIGLNPAYELSFLKAEEQERLYDIICREQVTPSLSQAQRMKQFSRDGRLSEDIMLAILTEDKRSDIDKVTLTTDTLRKYFPKNYTPHQMEETIIRLLDQWQKNRKRQQER